MVFAAGCTKNNYYIYGMNVNFSPSLCSEFCIFVYQFKSNCFVFEQAHGILEWLGLRFYGFIPALILPLLLTMVSKKKISKINEIKHLYLAIVVLSTYI